MSSYLAGVRDAKNIGEMTGTAKKSLLELEKTFNDQILDELKNGMQSKESVDHGELVGKVRNIQNELRQVYKKVTTAYYSKEAGNAREVAETKKDDSDGS